MAKDLGKPFSVFDVEERSPRKGELADHERAHSGKPGSKVRHGQDAAGRLQSRYQKAFDKHVQNTDGDIQEARRRAKDEVGIPMGNMRDFDKL